MPGLIRTIRIAILALFSTLILASCCNPDAPDWSAHSAYFPPVNRDKLRISLQRTACMGKCPDYIVSIDGSGKVVFQSQPWLVDSVSSVHRQYNPDDGVLFEGRHETQISAAEVDALLARFRKAGFFALKDEYRAKVTDIPSAIISIETGGGYKQVVDYAGESIGMPLRVTELQKAIDAAAGSDRWVRGTLASIAWLERSGFDFTSPKAAKAVVDGIESADDAMLVALVDKGAPLDAMVDMRPSRFNMRIPTVAGIAALKGAIAYGRPTLFERLRARGFLTAIDQQEARELFIENGAGCDPGMVKVAFESGVMRPSTEAGLSPADIASLTFRSLVESNYSCHRFESRGAQDAQLLATLQSLIDHGAKLDAVDEAGESALFLSPNPVVTKFLLAHGANAGRVNNSGDSAACGAYPEENVMLLLQAGANPRCSSDHGWPALPERAAQQGMSKVSLWLKMHRVK